MSECTHSLRIGLSVCPPRPRLQRVGKITEGASAFVVCGGIGREYFAMSKNCFEIFPAGGLKVLRLSLDNLQVSATVEICVARARA
jgi:hypothetical protein